LTLPLTSIIIEILVTPLSPVSGVRIPNTFTRKVIMYITTLDMLAVIIALVVSITLVVTSAIANARLTESVKYWRDAYFLSEKDNQKAGM
jgi:hypothetical protein